MTDVAQREALGARMLECPHLAACATDWLLERGVRVLAPGGVVYGSSHPFVTGEPNEQMIEAAWIADDETLSIERIRWMLRAALREAGPEKETP